jgi:CO/xanthine dehydrogenase Mo-binding subunit
MKQSVGDIEAAFREAEIVLRERYMFDRGAAMPMETRGILAHFDPRSGELEVWDATQAPIPIRAGLAAALGLREERVRVVAPDVGGGFGVKAFFFYPEEMLVPWASLQLGRAVKWIEDRSEHFVASTHERLQIHEVEVAATGEGVILGIRDSFVHDCGASIAYGIIIPLVTASHLAGQYRVPALDVEFTSIYTNRVPTSPYRGCGRPHACFVIERTLDALAERVGVNRVEIRRRNFVAADEFPYVREGVVFVDGQNVTLDSGDYDRQLSMLLELIDEPGFREEQREARKAGRRLGLGIACYVEATGVPPYEGAHVLIQPQTGSVRITTGVTNQGQSHRTALAQIAADELGVDPADVAVVEGDTDAFPWGVATYASRSAVIVGNAVARASAEVRRKVLRIVSNMLEVAPEDLEMGGGRVFVRGSPSRGVTLRQIALAANPVQLRYHFDPELAALSEFGPAHSEDEPESQLGHEPGLEASAYYSPSAPTWASGIHAAIVEVDTATGQLAYRRYGAVHDCGRVINPLIVEGQVMGGIAQGIGGAFYERLVYDEDGQMRGGTFMDYLIPYATEVPPIAIAHCETRSPLNELGIKGVGEAGVVAVSAVTASAIEDALEGERRLTVNEMPLSPASLYDLIRDDSSAGDAGH